MRVLMVSKFGYVRGGLERVMFDEMRWLREAGHEAEYFATADERNLPSPFSEVFPRSHEFGPGSSASLAGIRDMFWNPAAASALREVLDSYRPDVVHCHGIHRHLSPSVLAASKRFGATVALTAHDYFLVCPGNVLLQGGECVCEPRACGRVCYAAAMMHRCVQQSAARSALAAMELGYQRATHQYESRIDVLISPSAFLLDQMSKGCVLPRHRAVVANAVDESDDSTMAAGHARSGFVYAGRLSPEKGVDVALRAARAAGVQVTVAGDGPLTSELRRAHPEARFTGRLGRADVAALVASASGVLVPSLWFENAPMAVLEAMVAGVPAIASRIGGIPEQITDGHDGLLVQPGDVDGLAAAMRRLEANSVYAELLGRRARRTVEARFSPAAHARGLIAAYTAAGASS